MFQWIKQRGAMRQAAGELVEQIVLAMPVEREQQVLAFAPLPRASASAVRKVAGAAARLASERQLGVLWRAYLANRVRWGLADAGYSPEFVDSIVSTVVVAMSPGPRT